MYFYTHAVGFNAHERVAANNGDAHTVGKSGTDGVDDRFCISWLHAVARTQVGRYQRQHRQESKNYAHDTDGTAPKPSIT